MPALTVREAIADYRAYRLATLDERGDLIGAHCARSVPHGIERGLNVIAGIAANSGDPTRVTVLVGFLRYECIRARQQGSSRAYDCGQGRAHAGFAPKVGAGVAESDDDPLLGHLFVTPVAQPHWAVRAAAG